MCKGSSTPSGRPRRAKHAVQPGGFQRSLGQAGMRGRGLVRACGRSDEQHGRTHERRQNDRAPRWRMGVSRRASWCATSRRWQKPGALGRRELDLGQMAFRQLGEAQDHRRFRKH
jgi:hypothetical protein